MAESAKSFSRLLKEAKEFSSKLSQPSKEWRFICKRLEPGINIFSCKDSNGKCAVMIVSNENTPSLYSEFLVRTVNKSVKINRKSYLIIWEQHRFGKL